MFTLQNISIIITTILMLLYLRHIVAFLTLIFKKFTKLDLETTQKDMLNIDIKKYDKFLTSKGFIYQQILKSKNPKMSLNQESYILFYYNPKNSIHAFVRVLQNRDTTIEYVTFHKDSSISITLNNYIHHFLPKLKGFFIFDHYHKSFKDAYISHLKDRVVENREILNQQLSPKGFRDYLSYIEDQQIKSFIENNIIYKTENSYRFKPSISSIKYIDRFLQGDDKTKAIKKDKKESKKLSTTIWLSLFFSALTLIFFLLNIPLYTTLLVIFVLFVHEVGHFLAMRYFQYRDSSIYMLPILSKDQDQETTLFKRYITLLSGPLPGILIGYTILLTPIADNYPILLEYALISILLNYINLLPIPQLDGGKVVSLLLAKTARFYLYIALSTIVTVSSFLLKDIVLLLIFIILMLNIKNSYLFFKKLENINLKRGLATIGIAIYILLLTTPLIIKFFMDKLL